MRGLALAALALPWLLAPQLALALDPALAQDSAEEEANCRRVSERTEQNSAVPQLELEKLAQQVYGKSFAQLSMEEVLPLLPQVRQTGRQNSSAEEQQSERCATFQARLLERERQAGAVLSLGTAAYYLKRWGDERLAGLGCSCPGFVLGDDSSTHPCPQPVVCNGINDRPRQPDPAGACRSLLMSRWLVLQLPAQLRALGVPESSEAARNAAYGTRQEGTPLPPPCQGRPAPAPISSFLALAAQRSNGQGTLLPAALAAAGLCYNRPEPESCRQAAQQGDALVAAAARAGNGRCLAYAFVARTLWRAAANPDFTDLLITFPEASRLRNEAGIALRYLRVDCRRV